MAELLLPLVESLRVTIRRSAPRLAHERAKTTIKQRGQRPRLKEQSIRDYVKEGLQTNHWSPEQIAGTLPQKILGTTVSHEAIYQYIYSQYTRGGYGVLVGENLRIYLKRKHKVRKRKEVHFKVEKGAIKDRVLIDQRPVVVDLRVESGHWEGDSVVSKKSKVGLNTIVERVSGLVKISKIVNRTSRETQRVITKRLQRVPSYLRKTMTLDNGSENAKHKEITKQLNMPIYFAHPYHSWERGCNENTNGLIRYYFPKGTDFATISNEEIQTIERRLNNRPRKRLDYKTPQQVFNHCVALKH
ncbi:IS30 family transposase [Patescibacteria group bacterium]|nr:IS30 family transposase [Patescibacteria group bacterium]MBU1890307.1 IS30 family transposase [Patescibacteria group bacterium]